MKDRRSPRGGRRNELREILEEQCVHPERELDQLCVDCPDRAIMDVEENEE
jgi:hypothetical protein